MSNFGVLEDRETLNVEIYITLLGLNPLDFWRADVYRHVFSPPSESPSPAAPDRRADCSRTWRCRTTADFRAARDSRRDGIELTTVLDNNRAFALYQKVGFKYVGDVENVQGEGQVVIERAMFYAINPDAKPTGEPHRPPV